MTFTDEERERIHAELQLAIDLVAVVSSAPRTGTFALDDLRRIVGIDGDRLARALREAMERGEIYSNSGANGRYARAWDPSCG